MHLLYASSIILVRSGNNRVTTFWEIAACSANNMFFSHQYLPVYEFGWFPSGLLGWYFGSGAEVIKLFSCSVQLSLEVKVLIITEITKIGQNFCFRLPKPLIYPANKC